MAKTGTTWTYSYGADGLRTKRTNGTTTYEYIYTGSQLTRMTVGSNTLYFTYDASGVPLGVTYNGTHYYYVTNLQGDITAILDSSGAEVVTYVYDAWGNIRSTGGTMATTLGVHNPLRYRGYVYDTESKLYYLQSRYYDPEMGRFINADAYISTGQGFTGNNMFAYCGNNPVRYVDFDGQDFEEAVKTDEDEVELIPDGDGYAPANTGQSQQPLSGGNVNSSSVSRCIQIRSGHGSPQHKSFIDAFIKMLAESGKYLKIYGNRALSTAGFNGTQRPDIIAFGVNGRVDVWEIASASQATGTSGYAALQLKIGIMQAANPDININSIIPWESVIGQ